VDCPSPLKQLGINDLVHFDCMDSSAPKTLIRAPEMLYYLDTLDDNGGLIGHSEQTAMVPVVSPLAKTLILMAESQVPQEVTSVVVMLSVCKPFARPENDAKAGNVGKARSAHADGDLLVLLNVLHGQKLGKCDANWCNENFSNHRSRASDVHVHELLVRILKCHDLLTHSTLDNTDAILAAVTVDPISSSNSSNLSRSSKSRIH
jgi:pre-mRNA-splicing factor ATP-dependent RNA helicase DHX15/PRP43